MQNKDILKFVPAKKNHGFQAAAAQADDFLTAVSCIRCDDKVYYEPDIQPGNTQINKTDFLIMDRVVIIAQTAGIAAMVLTVWSMQCRSNKNFFLFQETAGVLFAVSFFMLGAWGGALMNIFGVIRPEILRRENIAKSKWALAGLLLLLAVCSTAVLFVSDEKWYLVLITTAAQMTGTCCMWTRNGKIIRIGQLLGVSPLWITYNFLIPIPSIGGVVTEVISIISCVVAMFRYRKTGFTER